MNYFNHDHFGPDDGHENDTAGASQAGLSTTGAGDMARQIAALLGRCLPIPDTPDLAYLRCFVTLAFEEASNIANRGTPSREDLDYIAFIEREAKAYTSAA